MGQSLGQQDCGGHVASVSESRDCCSLADPGHVTLLLVVRDRANCGLFFPILGYFFQFFQFWAKIWGKEMMQGKSGNTVNRGPVNRELTVIG